MKRTLITLSLFIAGAAVLFAGSSLDKLWAEYESACKSDKPKEQLAILGKIKNQAAKERDAWNWYDAAVKYNNAAMSVNWKLRDSLRQALDDEVRSFDCPAMFFRHFRNEADSVWVLRHKAELLKSSQSGFWKDDPRVRGCLYNEALCEAFQNDYDYAAWAAECDSLNFAGRYPLGALYEYRSLPENGFASFASRYEGKAVGLLARCDTLMRAFWRMQERKAGTADYLALKAECERFERDRGLFSGEEKLVADCCTGVSGLLETLEEKDVRAFVEEGVLTVTLRNVRSAKVTLRREKKTLLQKNVGVRNPGFYAPDSVKVELPALDDGDYTVTVSSAGIEREVTYRKYTISLASKCDASGLSVWAADYGSGEPLGSVDVKLSVDGSQVCECCALNMTDGFAALPDEFTQAASLKGNKVLEVSAAGDGFVRRSQPQRIYKGRSTQTIEDKPDRRAVVLTDRAAYNPGDTLHFKVILYEGTYSLRACAEVAAGVELYNADGEKINELSSRTDSYGSVAGEFVLERGKRGGNYSLMVDAGGEFIGSRQVVVDDFVLPTFALDFEDCGTPEPGDTIRVAGTLKSWSGHPLSSARVTFDVLHNGEKWLSGQLVPTPGGDLSILIPTSAEKRLWWDSYDLTVKVTDASGETQEFSKFFNLGRPVTEKRIERYSFKDAEGDTLGVKLVAGEKPVWVLMEIYGTGNVPLRRSLDRIDPGADSLAHREYKFDYDPSWPGSVEMYLLYFQDGKSHSHRLCRVRPVDIFDMPLTVVRFLDEALPAARCSLSFKTLPGAECAAAVYDRSTDAIAPNEWSRVRCRKMDAPTVSRSVLAGRNSSDYGIRVLGRMALKSSPANDAMPFQLVETAATFDASAESAPVTAYIRSDFRNSLYWEPSLKADSEGVVKFSFPTSDKLSTYVVQLFAHTPEMRNEVLRREFKVTIPVKLSFSAPQLLREGDRWDARIVVSNSSDSDVEGALTLNAMGPERVCVPARGQAVTSFPLVADGPEMELTARFTAGSDVAGTAFSDAVRVRVPVLPCSQTITEGHSAILPDGADPAAAEASLRAAFTMADGAAAAMKVLSLKEMALEALPSEAEPRSSNVLSLSMALLSNRLLGIERQDLLERALACRNADGGFAWFEGMDSSPVVTSFVLEMLRGILQEPSFSLRYLDKAYALGTTTPRSWAWITTAQYLYVRSLYPEVPCIEKIPAEKKREIRRYLRDGSGLKGMIFAKARRALTLLNTGKSAAKDIASLEQYAVRHPSGGVYFPNAVPARGLLQGELYAHLQLCELFERVGRQDIADGIRLWMMTQKETQEWKSDPAYVASLKTILEAPEAVLRTRVMSLTGSVTLPFEDIVPSSNGMSVSDVEVDGSAGGSFEVGDKVRLKITVRSDENRSFGRVVLPFGAALQPVDQLSGLSRRGVYRSVLKDRIEYWMELLPEEKTVFEEEFYVVRSGEFASAAPEAECLYAPHYRANARAKSLQWNGL